MMKWLEASEQKADRGGSYWQVSICISCENVDAIYQKLRLEMNGNIVDFSFVFCVPITWQS